MVKLFVGNIADGVTDEQLRAYFVNYGSVSECSVLGSYGFVHMETDAEAEQAIKNLDKCYVLGQELNVERSKSVGSGDRGRASRDRDGFGRGGNGFGCVGSFGDNSSDAKAARRVGCTKLHVANLEATIRSSDLRMLFDRYGYVAECDVVEDRRIAFVHIESNAAEAAIRGLNGREFCGMPLKVQMSVNQNCAAPVGMEKFREPLLGSGPERGRMTLGQKRGRGFGMGSMLPSTLREHSRAFPGGDGYGGYHAEEMFGGCSDDDGMDDLLLSLPPPAKDRLELLELLDRRRFLEVLDPYERGLIACPDPFDLPPPPPEYLHLLRERALVKARLPLPPSSLRGGFRAVEGRFKTVGSIVSRQRALIARRAAAVAANTREKMRSSTANLHPYANVKDEPAPTDNYMCGSIGEKMRSFTASLTPYPSVKEEPAAPTDNYMCGSISEKMRSFTASLNPYVSVKEEPATIDHYMCGSIQDGY